MGFGREMKCPKCEYTFHQVGGVGFLFPVEYAETVQKAKNGELGEEIQNFFKEHEDGTIRADIVTLRCEKCGTLKSEKDLTMFVPKGNKLNQIDHGKWSVAMPFEGAQYVDDDDLKRYYTEYMKYPHKCDNCGGSMHKLRNEEELACPACKVKMETVDWINWD